MSDEKRDRFLNVMPRRVEKALVALERVGRCGNRTSYQFTKNEIDRAFDRLNMALAGAYRKFSEPAKAATPTFTADDLTGPETVDEAGAS